MPGADKTALFDTANAHLVAGAAAALERDDASKNGAISAMIVGGGVALRIPKVRSVPTKIQVKDLEVLKFLAVGGLSGEHEDGLWWQREDQFNFKDGEEGFEAARAMKRSWSRVAKGAVDEPLFAPRFPGSAGSKDDWDRLVERAVELHNAGKLPGYVAMGAKNEWLDGPVVWPSLLTIRSANLDSLKKDPEVRCVH
jgi:hypothetical protein